MGRYNEIMQGLQEALAYAEGDPSAKVAVHKITVDDRDIAKEPVHDTEPRWGMGWDYYDWLCPRCHKFIAPEPAVHKIPKRCPECGQLLKKPTSERS